MNRQECLDWILDLIENKNMKKDAWVACHGDPSFSLADLMWNVANSSTEHISLCMVSKIADTDDLEPDIIYDGSFQDLTFYTVREYSDLEVLAFAGDHLDMRILLDGTKLNV